MVAIGTTLAGVILTALEQQLTTASRALSAQYAQAQQQQAAQELRGSARLRFTVVLDAYK